MMNQRALRFGLLALVALIGTASAGSRTEAAPAAAPVAPPAPSAALGAKSNPLEAVFEATKMTPVAALPKAWAELTVLEAVPHGARVKRGEAMIKLDLDKLRDQADELEIDRPAAAAALQVATAETENLQQTTPYRLEAARRAQRIATEDLAYFEKTGRGQREKNAEYSVKGAQQRLNNDKEELKQLKKMYKADDLVEETEEIILKRQEFAVELSTFHLEEATLNADWSLKQTIPREAEYFKAQKRDQDAALTLAEQTLPISLAKKQFDLAKMKRDQKRTEKRLADLKADLEQLAFRAPMAGLVYYGACEGGKWTTGAAVAKKLIPGGKLTPGEVVLTLVDPSTLCLKAVVPESALARFTPGKKGVAALVSAPDKKIAVRLESISPVPLPTGGFETRWTLQAGLPDSVVPGMTGRIVLDEPAQPAAPAPVQ